jgi:hypothetical protein
MTSNKAIQTKLMIIRDRLNMEWAKRKPRNGGKRDYSIIFQLQEETNQLRLKL